jgi:hypothetical protein
VESRKRSVGQQVKNGFLIAGELVGGFLVFILAGIGFARLFSEAPTHHFMGPLIAWAELAVATTIMFATAERWGGFIPGFFFLRGASGGIFYTIFPPSAAPARPHGITRPEAALLAIYSILIIAVLWRFIPPRRVRATLVDRTALTIFALSVAIMGALPPSTALRAPLAGSVPLLIAWVIYRWNLGRHRAKHPHADIGPAGTLNGDPLEVRRG